MSIENPSSPIENPSFSADDKENKKKKTGLGKSLVAAGLLVLGGAVAASSEAPKADNDGKGNPDTTQVPSGKKSHESHERLGMQSIGFDKAPTFSSEASGSSGVDSLLTKTESLGASLSVKKKDLTKTGYIADTDTQIKGKSFQTAKGSNTKVEQKFKQWKKDNPQKNVTQVVFK
jgi:hypothetical protein